MVGEERELSGERLARREPVLGLGEAVLGSKVERQAEPLARPGLDAVAADGFGQEIRGDAEQPRKRRTVALVPDAAASEPRLGKCFGGQVARRPLDPPAKPAVNLSYVARIQLAEGRRIRGTEERGVTPTMVVVSSAAVLHISISHRLPQLYPRTAGTAWAGAAALRDAIRARVTRRGMTER